MGGATKTEWYQRMAPGSESEWINLATLEVSGGRLAICDTEFIGDHGGMCPVYVVQPGTYRVAVKVIALANGERRNSRMRATLSDAPILGQTLDEGVPVDFWRVTIYDPVAWETSGCDDPKEFERFLQAFKEIDTFGVLLSPGLRKTAFPFGFSGMGAGFFPVVELLQDGKRVGLEVVFIGPEELEEHPDQKIIQRLKP